VRRASTKTDAGERFVMLDSDAVLAVRALQNMAWMAGARDRTDFLLPLVIHNKQINPKRHMKGWDRAWRTLRGAAALQHVHFHDLRHTYITTAAEAGVPVETMIRQVGHLSAEQTRYYTQVRDRAMAEAVEQIEKYRRSKSVNLQS
jgi:integrase